MTDSVSDNTVNCLYCTTCFSHIFYIPDPQNKVSTGTSKNKRTFFVLTGVLELVVLS